MPALLYGHCITTTGSNSYRPRIGRSEAIGSTATRISAAWSEAVVDWILKYESAKD